VVRPYSWRGDVGEISGNTRGVDYIVQSKLVNERAGLEEERQWLQIDQLMLRSHSFL